VSPPSQLFWPAIRLLVLCFLLTAPGLCVADPVADDLTLTPVDSLPLPPGQVTGLAWIGPDTILVLSDVPADISRTGSAQVLLRFQDPQGNVFREEDFTGTLNRGLAFDGEFLWSCGDDPDGSSKLFKIEPDTCLVKEVFPTAGHHPCGMAWDGQFIWIVDRDSGRLDRFDPEQQSITRSVLTPGFSPYGLASGGSFCWVSDSGTGRLYRLVGQRRRWTGTVEPASFCFRDHDVVLAWQGGFLWYCPAGSRSVYAARFE